MKTTTTCRSCGSQIPENVLEEALCVRCRYKPEPKREPAGPTEYEIALEQQPELSEPQEPDQVEATLAALEQVWPDREKMRDILDNAFDQEGTRRGDERAAQVLRLLFQTLEGKAWAPYRLALLSALGGQKLRTNGHKGIGNTEVKRLRERLLRPGKHSRPPL